MGKKGLSAPAQELQDLHVFDLWKRERHCFTFTVSEHLKEEVGQKVQVNYYPAVVMGLEPLVLRWGELLP